MDYASDSPVGAVLGEPATTSDYGCPPHGSPTVKPLNAVPDADDLALHELLCNEALVTERLGELVPLLKFIGFKIDLMTPQKTVLSASLLETAMNQNGTHQASVFYLLADYTLGVAMFAALPGCYTIGVHDRCNGLPIQFWLKSGSVEHKAPGNGLIRGEACITPEQAQQIRSSLIAKGRCEFSVPVTFYRGDQLVAVANHVMGAYAEMPRAMDARKSLVQFQNQKTSALMIAGLRGDPVSAGLADEQGVAIAQRMQRATPQLPTLVAARTRHLTGHIEAAGGLNCQVVVLGAGLDAKSLQFASPGQHWFICDLPEMLRYREERFAALKHSERHCTHVAVDFRTPAWWQKIIDAGFDPDQPSLVIFEGVSMYFPAAALRGTIDQIRQLCRHKQSRLWLDHVTESAFALDLPEVRAFLSSMARLGEPFVTGFGDPAQFMGAGNWRLVESRSAADVLGIVEAVHSEYRFSLLAAA